MKLIGNLISGKMKLIGILILAALLTGCASLGQKPEIVIKTEVIKLKIPQSLMEIPPYPKGIDVESATQADVSKFIAESERRMYELERKLEAIKEFNDVTIEQLEGNDK